MPTDLFRRTKVAAARRGQTLKEFIASAIRAHLASLDDETGVDEAPEWLVLAGELSSEEEQATREVDAIVTDEFSKIDIERWR